MRRTVSVSLTPGKSSPTSRTAEWVERILEEEAVGVMVWLAPMALVEDVNRGESGERGERGP